MQSFKEYSNSKFTYYNSIQSSIENKISESYEELISKHGASIDSILYKMNLYNKRIRNNNYINENSQNVLFNIDEQFAARDILVTIANQYIESLCNEFCQENDIMIEESAKDFLNKIGQAAKAGSDKVTQGFKSLGEKVSKLKEFIKDIMNKAIKSAKELVEKITDLMLSIGGTLSQLVEKLGGNEKESYDIFKELVANTVKDEKVSKENVYESIADKLNNGELITEKYITEFLGFGKKKDKDAAEKGNEYDLSPEEKAFFDALGNDPQIKELMKDEILVQIAKELVDIINDNMTIDWDIRKDARARMRYEIKKLLIKYDYPPVKRESAVQLVIKQAELKCKGMIEED